MIKKELRLVITFHTTTDAMAMEQACKETQAGGRLIPVPTSITAGCGLAWCAAPERRAELESLMHDKRIPMQEIHLCMV